MRYIAETNIYLTVKVEDFEVQDVNRLTNDEVIKLFKRGFDIIRDKLGPLTQYCMMNDKIISDYSIDVLEGPAFDVHLSFYWEKEYELSNEISSFRSVELHITNKITEELKRLQSGKLIGWIYPNIKNIRMIFDKPIENENVGE